MVATNETAAQWEQRTEREESLLKALGYRINDDLTVEMPFKPQFHDIDQAIAFLKERLIEDLGMGRLHAHLPPKFKEYYLHLYELFGKEQRFINFLELVDPEDELDILQ